jgi:hypothetical protein
MGIGEVNKDLTSRQVEVAQSRALAKTLEAVVDEALKPDEVT